MKQLIKKAKAVKEKYYVSEIKKIGRKWTSEEQVLGLIVDVGELAELVMAKEGIRTVDDVDKKLTHELADCLYSILILADKYGIDIEQAFLKTMAELEIRE